MRIAPVYGAWKKEWEGGDTLIVAITIDGTPKEIAALAAAMRERQEVGTGALTESVTQIIQQAPESL